MTEDTDLGGLIDRQIKLSGPISIAAYMSLCLSHSQKGYYRAGKPIGASGDFITAPEISQIFGELIGAWTATIWQQMGEPFPVTLLELGPGRGTLMADALRTAGRVPGFTEALDLQLYESHADLRAEQAKALADYGPKWTDDLVPGGDAPLIVIANEFFDALPVRQFVRSENTWHERMVGLKDGKRSLGLHPAPIPDKSLPETVRDAPANAVYETSPTVANVMSQLSEAITRRGGAVLIIDYGYAQTQTGETLQAVRRHQFADLLEHPGDTDLSAHVNFSVLADEAHKAGLTAHALATQEEFLTRLGIRQRASALARANPADSDGIETAVNRLTGTDAMGTLFKIFCAASPGLMPPGFSE